MGEPDGIRSKTKTLQRPLEQSDPNGVVCDPTTLHPQELLPLPITVLLEDVVGSLV